jgi:uncharacterized protein (TIGR03084 family)
VDDPVVQALDDQQQELESLVGGLDDAGLLRPTRCAGWTVSDVLLHLAQTNEAAVASVEGRLAEHATTMVTGPPDVADVDAWADDAVAAERSTPPAEVRERWRRSAADQLAAFRSCDASDRVTWVAGDLAARTLASTRLAETWIHTVDVASATGSRPEPTDRLWHVARLAWRTLPHAFAFAGAELHGPVAFELVAPDGSDWVFTPHGGPATTVVRGSAADLCEVAGRRTDAAATGLTAEGPDGAAVLGLVRTFA